MIIVQHSVKDRQAKTYRLRAGHSSDRKAIFFADVQKVKGGFRFTTDGISNLTFRTMKSLKEFYVSSLSVTFPTVTSTVTPTQFDPEELFFLAERITLELGQRWQIEVTIRRSSGFATHHVKVAHNRSKIQFGIVALTNETNSGFAEYVSVRHVWNGIDTSGLRAVWAIALHEFAHALTVNEVGYVHSRGTVHGPRFQANLEMLIRHHSYETFE